VIEITVATSYVFCW